MVKRIYQSVETHIPMVKRIYPSVETHIPTLYEGNLYILSFREPTREPGNPVPGTLRDGRRQGRDSNLYQESKNPFRQSLVGEKPMKNCEKRSILIDFVFREECAPIFFSGRRPANFFLVGGTARLWRGRGAAAPRLRRGRAAAAPRPRRGRAAAAPRPAAPRPRPRLPVVRKKCILLFRPSVRRLFLTT